MAYGVMANNGPYMAKNNPTFCLNGWIVSMDGALVALVLVQTGTVVGDFGPFFVRFGQRPVCDHVNSCSWLYPCIALTTMGPTTLDAVGKRALWAK